MNKLSVFMPVFNEARTLRTIVGRVLASPIDLEIELICVDDCSNDNSLAILHELAASDSRIKVVAQPVNMGKGKAIRTAIENMTGDIGIVQDGDLEYDPAEYPKMIGPILEGKADAVYGSRFAASAERRVLFFWHAMGNKLLTAMSNMANDINLTDMETCYKAVRADILHDLRLTSDRFGIEPEITARLARYGARIYEVPISYHGRTYAEGKTIGWRDGVQALWLIFKFRFFDTKSSVDAGYSTLESLSATPGVARWTMEQFSPHLGGRVFEAGSGMGNLTAQLLDRESLVVADIDERHVREVRKRFGHLENLEIVQGDLQDPGFYEGLSKEFDSVLCVNVLEHLDAPDVAVAEFFKATRSGGKFLVLVPTHEWLFSEADRALGHRLRFTEAGLRQLLEDTGYVVEDLYDFNRLGVLGWYVNKVFGRTEIAPWQARLFAFLLPLARLVDRLSFLPGLSLVAVARVP
ncbi:MAG TPA: glycosyltransferase [Acidimicrobiia bacterium]|nr:glycosyltransferase [Acidimicrobiia bacterium]